MQNVDTFLAVLDATERRRAERRTFLKTATAASVAAGGLLLLSACGDDDDDDDTQTPPPTQQPTVTDADLLNYALNLEYLEAQFYSFAAFGVGLQASLLTGIGTPGGVTGGRQVQFTDPVVREYAREIAADEIAHVAFLRRNLGGAAVAQPALNISGDANGAFTAAARAAGVVPSNGTFDPYSSDEFFLLGAYIFEDVGVTAYKGGAPLITSRVFLEAAAGILAAEAYHAGLVRTVLFRKGLQTDALFDAAERISNARDSLDGATDLDQGIRGTADTSNIVPADSNALAFSRNTQQVHNIVYLNATGQNRTRGGFFPNGTNNRIPELTVGLG